MPSYTPLHSERVSKITDVLLDIFNENEWWKKHVEENNRIKYIKLGAKLHDIGKICIDNRILFRNGRLLHHQNNLMEKHTEHGKLVLKKLPWKDQILHMIEHHHSFSKRSETTKLPKKLSQGKLAEAYLVAIADNIEALTTKRPYPQYYIKDGERKELEQKEVFSVKDAIHIICTENLKPAQDCGIGKIDMLALIMGKEDRIEKVTGIDKNNKKKNNLEPTNIYE